MTRILLLASLLLGATASAQPAPDVQKQAEAKTLYEQGLNHYNLGKFDLAIEAFTKAYELSAAPGLLFNIAQSHRLNKEYEKASYFYTTYLRLKPDAANRADVEQRVIEMDRLLEEQKKLDFRPPTGTMTPDGNDRSPTTTEPPTTTTTAPPTTTADVSLGSMPADGVGTGSDEGKTLRTAGIATAVVGAAFVVTGVVFGSRASSAESELNGVTAWSPAEQDRYDAGKRNNSIAIATLVIGGAAVAAGGTMFVLGTLKKKDATIAVSPTRGGTTVAVGWSF